MAGPHDAALQPRGRRRAATGAKPPAPPPHNGVLQHDAAAGSPKNGGCKAPPVVLTSGPGLRLHLPDIIAVCRQGRRVQLDPSPAFAARIAAGPRALARTLAAGEVVYGVNTGFGGNACLVIPGEEAEHHQANLLEFLACGVGPPLPPDVVRGAVLLRANALARGLSAVRLELLQRLVDLLNSGITPLVPRWGSVGASGDLIPSSYIARALTGRGAVRFRGGELPAAAALAAAGVPPLALHAKEGLALLNGTAVMTAAAACAVADATHLLDLELGAAALTAEALGSSPDYYDAAIQAAKHHPGQAAVAAALRALLAGSAAAVPLAAIRRRLEAAEAAAAAMHDVVTAAASIQRRAGSGPYSLRCIPQGLGPVAEGLAAAREVVEREANSANDNPLISPETGQIHHTGNFLGSYIAHAMDGAKLGLVAVANWSHSLMGLLMDPRLTGGALPPSLSPHPGVYQGFKGAQLCHTSLVAALRHCCAPSLLHSLPTEQNNQDVVSLGLHSALTALDACELLKPAVAIHLLAAAQAVDLRQGAGQLGASTARLHRALRHISARLEADRPLDADVAAVVAAIDARALPVVPVWGGAGGVAAGREAS